MDTLNKHEHLSVVTHNAKIGLIVAFGSPIASSIVLPRLTVKK